MILYKPKIELNIFRRLKFGPIHSVLPKPLSEYYQVSDKDDAAQILQKYSDWGDSYSQMSRSSKNHPIECYCGYSHITINGYLRNYFKDFPPLAERNQSPKVTELEQVIENAPRIPVDIVVYRAVRPYFADSLIANNKKGCNTKERGFMSTSLSFETLVGNEEFESMSNILKIYIPRGRSAVFIDAIKQDNAGLGMGRNEMELLFPPGCELSLVKAPYKGKYGKRIFECMMV